MRGMFERGTIFVFGQNDVIVAPNTCLQDTDKDVTFDSVFTAGVDNIAHLRKIEIAYLTADNVVIASGLEEGDAAVTEARGELQEGSAVDILETQEGISPAQQPVEEGKEEKGLIIH